MYYLIEGKKNSNISFINTVSVKLRRIYKDNMEYISETGMFINLSA